MALLASPEKLGQLLQLSPEDEHLLLALERASSAFIGAVDWSVLQGPNEHLLWGDGGQFLRLPARPVKAATARLGTDDEADLLEGAVLDGRLGVLWRRAGWPDGEPIHVSYIAGWEPPEVPGDIQDAVLERASHLAKSLGTVKQESTLGMSVTYADGGVTQNWVDVVERYRVGAGDWS